jgi:hypothetical protein
VIFEIRKSLLRVTMPYAEPFPREEAELREETPVKKP